MRRAISFATVVLAFGQALFAQPQFRNAGATLIAEEFTNKVIQSTERVTVSLALKNVGNQTASNLVATIRSGNAVSMPVPQTQNYGLLAPYAPSAAREFAFTANAPSNSLLLVNLDLKDSGRSFGTVTFRFRIGPEITSVANSGSVSIDDRTATAPYPSVLSVSNVHGSIVDVSVTLSNLSHSFPDDLDILLMSPSGDAVLLMSDACGASDFDERTLIFTDHAEQALPNSSIPDLDPVIVRPTNHANYENEPPDTFPLPAPPGPYAEGMSAFNGKTANGEWKLFIVDDATGDSGSLEEGWSLTITTLQPMDAIPTLTLLPRTNNNTIRFAVSGRPHNAYAVESLANPVAPFPLERFVMPASGVQHFEFPVGPANLFFRAATDP